MSAARYQWWITVCLVLTSWGCAGTSQPTPEPAPEPAPAFTVERPDPGPRLRREVGAPSPEALPGAQVQATAAQQQGDRLYLEAPLPAEISGWLEGGYERSVIHAQVEGLPGVVFLEDQRGNQGQQRRMLLRLRGQARPTSVTLRLYGGTDWLSHWSFSQVSGASQQVTVQLPAELPARETLEADFYQMGANWFQQRAQRAPGQDGFSAFAAQRLAWRAQQLQAPKGLQAVPPTPGRRTELGRMMSFFSGLDSVEEALQTDRGLLLRADSPEPRELPLAQVAGLPQPPHPWAQMLARLPGGAKPAMEPLADAAPQDKIYLHFHDLRSLLELGQELDTWLLPLGLAMEGDAGPAHFTARYERQLGLESNGLARSMGHLAADGVAVLLGDPYLREGTDISLLFQVKNQSLLEGALASYEHKLKDSGLKLERQSWSHKGHQVSQLSSADREVFQHSVKLGQVLVVSNSPAAVRQLIDIHEKAQPSLSQSGDFQYMRALYPFDRSKEDGFLFLGDSLVARVAGPRDKIQESRRLRAHADLQAIHNAALLHGWMEGAPPKDSQALLSRGWLQASELKHFDGSPISYSLDQGARSEAWGQPWRMRALADLPIDKVSQQEAQAYGRFRDTYQSYWSGYVDPVAVQIRLNDGDLDLDGRILPLIRNSDYDELVNMVGQQTMEVRPLQSGARVVLAVGEHAELRRVSNFLVSEMSQSKQLDINWLGDWVMAGMADRGRLWDLALRNDAVPQSGQPPQLGMLSELRELPLYVGAHIRNKLALAATLTALRKHMDTLAPGLLTWEQVEAWRDTPITRVREANALQSGEEPLALYYAIAGDVLLASLDRATLETQINLVLDQELLGPGEQTQSALLYAPSQGEHSWMNQVVLGMVEWGALRNHQAAARQRQVLQQGLGEAWSQARDPREVALRWMGREPEVFQGGTWSLRNGLPHHSLYGDLGAPTLPRLPIEGAPSSQALARLRSAGLHLAIEGQGEDRGLRLRVKLQKR